MSEEILMNITAMESRVALVEAGMLQEVYIERTRNRGIVGNIYKGKIVRVLPGLQAAFVDIGLERAAFIHAREVVQKQNVNDANIQQRNIYELVHEGQSLIVQVMKDPLATKGARLTTHISIPSRYLVYMPHNNQISISLRIEDVEERERLQQLLISCVNSNGHSLSGMSGVGGFILRTAAKGVGEDELHADILFLRRLWENIEEQIKDSRAPARVYEDLPLYMKTIRDVVSAKTEKIYIDSKDVFDKVSRFVKKLIPVVDGRIEYFHDKQHIFDLFGVEDELNRALSRKVQLKSGGYLVIEQTEAMTTIDVNTGAFVGHRKFEETIFQTNTEAVFAIARQLRLRNLGGIIIIDFIDMEDPEHQRQIQQTLEKALEEDSAKTSVTEVSELGLVEMTRKRTRESLGNVLCEPCPACDGRGTMKTSETVCCEIFREIISAVQVYEGESYMVLASEEVIGRLLDEESRHVAELEEFIKKRIRFQVEPVYTQEQFDVVLV